MRIIRQRTKGCLNEGETQSCKCQLSWYLAHRIYLNPCDCVGSTSSYRNRCPTRGYIVEGVKNVGTLLRWYMLRRPLLFLYDRLRRFCCTAVKLLKHSVLYSRTTYEIRARIYLRMGKNEQQDCIPGMVLVADDPDSTPGQVFLGVDGSVLLLHSISKI